MNECKLKNNFFIFMLIILFFLPNLVFSESFKIAYVNLKVLYDESAMNEKAKLAYEREKKDIIAARDSIREVVNKKIRELKIEQIYLKSNDFRVKAKKIRKEVKRLNKAIKKVNKQLAELETEKKLEIFLDISEAIESIAKDRGIKLVLNRKNSVIYGDKAIDITTDVLDILTEIDERDHPNAK